MNGESVTRCVGQQDGFLDCQARKESLAILISQANIEVTYQVTYGQGESITVHMGYRDMVF